MSYEYGRLVEYNYTYAQSGETALSGCRVRSDTKYPLKGPIGKLRSGVRTERYRETSEETEVNYNVRIWSMSLVARERAP